MSDEAAEVEAEDPPDDVPAPRRKMSRVSDEEDEPAPFLVDRNKLESDFSRANFDFPGRPVVDLDKEINNRNRLYGTVNKLRYNDEAKVIIERILPETWEGQPTKGYSGEYHVNTFQTAADLLEQIKRTSGGYLYDVVFSAPNKAGEQKTLTRCRVHINAPPVVVTAKTTNGNGHSVAPNPNMELVGKVFETQQKMIDQTRKESDDPRMFAQVTNIVREMRASGEKTMEAMMKVQQDQINNLMKQLDRSDKPDAGLIKFTSEQAAHERNQIQSRFDMEKTALVNFHTQQMDSLRRDHQLAIDNVRRDKESEITRMTSQLSSLENQHAMMKLSLETNFNTQISNMKSTYENQIANAKSSYDLQMQLNLNRISTLESQVKTLETQRDQLMLEKITDAKNRPDSLSAMAGTMAAVKELAGAMGLQKDTGSNEPELVSTFKALKELGIGDTLGKIADRFTGPKPQQMTPVQQMQAQGYTPLGTYQVPVNAQGQPLVPPQPPQPQPQPPQPAAPQPTVPRSTAPAPTTAPQVNLDDVQAPQRAPRVRHEDGPTAPLPAFDPEALRPTAALFERAMTEGWPIDAFAAEIVRDLPRELLIMVVNAGSDEFLAAVEKVVSDSDLTSVKGTSWLQAMFDHVRKLLAAPPAA